MPPTPSQFAAAAAAEIPSFFLDTAEMLINGEGRYLAEAEPRSATSRVGQAVGRAYCRLYGSNPESVEAGKQTRVERACRPYLDTLGASSGLGLGSEFQGGQCPGVQYWLQYADNSSPNSWVENIALIRGGLITRADGVPIGPGPAGTTTWRFTICSSTGCGTVDANTFNGFRTRLIRADGQPDTCGNPAPVIRPPSPQPNPQPPPFRFNPTPEIDVSINVAINNDASLTFNIGTGPVTVDPFADPAGGGSGSGVGPGDVGEPGAPSDTGDGGDADGEAPPDTVLTGLKVGFVVPPVGRTQYAPGVFRGVCYVYMGTSDGVDHDPAGAMLRDGQFIFAEKENLTHWFVSANQGYNLRVTPYYRPVEVEGG